MINIVKMKNILKFILISVLSIGILYGLYAALNLYTGWYGREVWKYRVGTSSINESKKRNVYVNKLNYKIVDSANLNGFYFKPYIEKGFRYGYHSMKKTKVDTYTKYPYNLGYERNKKDSIVLNIFPEDRVKIDSSDVNWGYLKQPYLKDTIRIGIEGMQNQKGIIKIW